MAEPEPGLLSDWWLGHRQGLWVKTLVPVSWCNAPNPLGQGAHLRDTPLASSRAAVNNQGTLRGDFDFLCLVSRKAVPWSNRPCRHSWEHRSLTGTYRHSSLLLTLSQRPASGMWEGLQRTAECTGSNLGGVEITGELGKEFTMKAMKEASRVRHKQELMAE